MGNRKRDQEDHKDPERSRPAKISHRPLRVRYAATEYQDIAGRLLPPTSEGRTKKCGTIDDWLARLDDWFIRLTPHFFLTPEIRKCEKRRKRPARRRILSQYCTCRTLPGTPKPESKSNSWLFVVRGPSHHCHSSSAGSIVTLLLLLDDSISKGSSLLGTIIYSWIWISGTR
jgi:hypothetical protein